jgi:hypothetical protein
MAEDDITTRVHALERGQAVHAAEILELRATDARFGALTKWALPLLLSLHLGANGWLAAEVRSLVALVSRIEERLSATDRRVETIEKWFPPPPAPIPGKE